MIVAYHGKADCPAAEVLAVNPFAPAVQTAERLRGCDRSSRPRQKCRHAIQGIYASITRDEQLLSRAH
jgi:hypothetical protein